jgi:predicted amidophosphoribosyltransferase
MTLTICGFCYELAAPADRFCEQCGHELGVPLLSCRCQRCRGQLVPVGDVPPPLLEDLPLFMLGGVQ